MAGSLLLLVLIAGLVVYRNWRYEQELDSLLWKVDFREIKMADAPGSNGAANGAANGHVQLNGQLNGQAERLKDKQGDAPDGHQVLVDSVASFSSPRLERRAQATYPSIKCQKSV